MAANRLATRMRRKDAWDSVPTISFARVESDSLRCGASRRNGIWPWVPIAETRMATKIMIAAATP